VKFTDDKAVVGDRPVEQQLQLEKVVQLDTLLVAEDRLALVGIELAVHMLAGLDMVVDILLLGYFWSE